MNQERLCTPKDAVYVVYLIYLSLALYTSLSFPWYTLTTCVNGDCDSLRFEKMIYFQIKHYQVSGYTASRTKFDVSYNLNYACFVFAIGGIIITMLRVTAKKFGMATKYYRTFKNASIWYRYGAQLPLIILSASSCFNFISFNKTLCNNENNGSSSISSGQQNSSSDGDDICNKFEGSILYYDGRIPIWKEWGPYIGFYATAASVVFVICYIIILGVFFIHRSKSPKPSGTHTHSSPSFSGYINLNEQL
ncbi:hypothetical protein DFA_11509 [Cavenderia fasciculata]|uniref:Transmembrane protein n=1 Tax=Cavenderia fasciculata TaxID=261658 RepID=F4QDC0_CACFS|nr:uncharacterized protein DFA_11509 [Cavenderia fasciculata]EGG13748.1 hypothetical protein DFA_11509 [Cavenderia fasciculata]|eukprot:XP_004350455.1 hypothetical protein DFA_11509 [Cavenderia fasciculata]